MVTLNTPRLVMFQFSFSNSDVIPQAVKRLNKETLEERNERKNHSSGMLIIEPTENCSLVEFLRELEAAGYEMVGAFYKERIDAKDPRNQRTYHMIRFLFARCEFADILEEFKKIRDTIRVELQNICESAMWRVRVYDNPFYENDEEIPDHRTLGINLEARKPFFCPNGQPVTVWQKDKAGKRVGEAPLPLKPDYYFHLEINTIRLAMT